MISMKRWQRYFWLMGLLGWGALTSAQTLTVFAASSLTEAFTDIAAAFEADNPGVTVLLNVAGSATLRTQIEQGAPADVFASANLRHMDTLTQAKLVAEVQLFAGNRLVVICQPAADIRVLADVGREGVHLVIAAPQVPAGEYALMMLEHLAIAEGQDLVEAIRANVISEELNVRQVVSKVLLGEADAGVVYQSDALVFDELAVVPIADEVNVTAHYPIALVAGAGEVGVARAFIRFVLSEVGQQLLVSYGFLSATD